MEIVNDWAAHGGRQLVIRHDSRETGTPMTFALFVPPGEGPFPLLTYLSGLTCTHANVMEKGEYRRAAAEHGIAVLCPDTSPRGEGVADSDDYDLGQGAGFYVDATEEPWAPHFRMHAYVEDEVTALAKERFAIDPDREAIMGHSMGGHGALVMGLRHPGRFRSVSAFAPIVAPTQVPWGQKAFRAYLGDRDWNGFDATSLVKGMDDAATAKAPPILIDQGEDDPFLEEQLRTDLFKMAAEANGFDVDVRMQPGFDHSYYTISTFMPEHIAFHAKHLKA